MHSKLKKARFSPKVPYFLSSPLGLPPHTRQAFSTKALVKQQLLSCPLGSKAPVPSSALRCAALRQAAALGGTPHSSIWQLGLCRCSHAAHSARKGGEALTIYTQWNKASLHWGNNCTEFIHRQKKIPKFFYISECLWIKELCIASTQEPADVLLQHCNVEPKSHFQESTPVGGKIFHLKKIGSITRLGSITKCSKQAEHNEVATWDVCISLDKN